MFKNIYKICNTGGSEDAHKRAMQRERQKIFTTEPQNAIDFQISDEWAKSLKKEDWLLSDLKIGEDRILIFSTFSNLQILSVCKFNNNLFNIP